MGSKTPIDHGLDDAVLVGLQLDGAMVFEAIGLRCETVMNRNFVLNNLFVQKYIF